MNATGRRLRSKFSTCKRIACLLEKIPLTRAAAAAEDVGAQVAALEREFALRTVATVARFRCYANDECFSVGVFGRGNAFFDMSRGVGGATRCDSAQRDEFGRIVLVENFVGQLDCIVDKCARIARAGGVQSSPLALEFEMYYSEELEPPSAEFSNVEICPSCFVDGCVDVVRSELKCPLCGHVWELVGAIFDDAQFYSQECQKAKSGKFNPSRHYDAWIMRILALEPDSELCRTGSADEESADGEGEESQSSELSESERSRCIGELISNLRRIILRKNYLLHVHITPDSLREMLREIDRTCLNRNVPLIMKFLTGIGPPRPPDHVLLKLRKYFTRVLEIRDKLFPRTTKQPNRTNRNNYPYYIYKILDCILPDASPLRSILFYIYLQSRTTLKKNDFEWEKICDLLGPEISFKTTDRDIGLKYHPQV